MGKTFKLFGALFFIIGITIVFNSSQSVTGFAVYENVDLKFGYIIGAWFVLTGIILFVYRKKKK